MRKVVGVAKLRFKEKLVLRGGLLQDGVVWSVPESNKYPNGIRYRLALVDVETGKLLALFDNHWPKGHHFHSEDGAQKPYAFESLEKLVRDYLIIVRREELNRESEKN